MLGQPTGHSPGFQEKLSRKSLFWAAGPPSTPEGPATLAEVQVTCESPSLGARGRGWADSVRGDAPYKLLAKG